MVDYDRDSVLSMPLTQGATLSAPPNRTGTTAPLTRLLVDGALLLLMVFMIQGCGLVVDAVQLVSPIATNELDAICARGQVRVGMAVEPFQPFVFPAIYTDEGVRVTGLDVELVREISSALSQRCGSTKPIVLTLHLICSRNLFVELTEGNLDLFVSSISANVPAPGQIGLAYSNPYFDAGESAASQHKLKWRSGSANTFVDHRQVRPIRAS